LLFELSPGVAQFAAEQSVAFVGDVDVPALGVAGEVPAHDREAVGGRDSVDLGRFLLNWLAGFPRHVYSPLLCASYAA
jgi:hypothetical protein